MRILSLAEAKARLSQLVADIAATDEEVTITKNGRAAAVLISYEEFESWKETLTILSNRELVTEIGKGETELKEGRAKTLNERGLDRLFADEP